MPKHRELSGRPMGSPAVFRGTSAMYLTAVALIALGSLLRWGLADIPNFAPVCGLALFSGFLFPSIGLRLAVPMGVMAVTDMGLGGYQPLLRVVVYASLAAPVLLAPILRRSMRGLLDHDGLCGRGLAGMCSCVLASSLLFFFATNMATWIVTDWYPKTWTGLADCLVMALPFFRFTLAGDLLFSFVLFGGYAALFARETGLARGIERDAYGSSGTWK